jgi:menaquinone-9 beta-reductase
VTGGRFDAIVVGAGPAGSTAALVLARGGARVALVDKAEFPREKACGDLVGPRGVQVLSDLGVQVAVPYQGTTILAVGPSGGRARLPAPRAHGYADHGVCVPRAVLDDALRTAAVEAGAIAVKARISGVDQGTDGQVAAVVAADGRKLAGDTIIGADGALSQVAQLTGMLRPETALWGFAIRAYLPGQVPVPILSFLDARPWRIFPGYGWLFPSGNGQANIGMGVALGNQRRQAQLRTHLTDYCARLRACGDLAPDAEPGTVTGGWMRMGGTGTPLHMGNVLLAGDAAGLVNPLQGEGISSALVSGHLAGVAVLADPGRPGRAYAAAIDAVYGRYLPGAAFLQTALVARPRAAAMTFRLLTAPLIRNLIGGTWSLYWNGLVAGAQPGPATWNATLLERVTGYLASRDKRALGIQEPQP